MSSLNTESIMETCYDEAWEIFRIANKLTDDQLYALCEASPSGTLEAIERQAQEMFEDRCI